MGADSPRIEELRRRVQQDPASIAFAQLAEEYRRCGDFEEAARVSRSGLLRYPEYLSARVTLGRALVSLNQLDEAELQFKHVLEGAPDNLAAARSLAEIRQKRGEPPLATPPSLMSSMPRASEVLFDLDQLLEQLDERAQKPASPPPSYAAPVAKEPVHAYAPIAPEFENTSSVPSSFTFDDESLLALERGLTAYEPPRPEPAVDARKTRAMNELESWLDAIVSERQRRSGT